KNKMDSSQNAAVGGNGGSGGNGMLISQTNDTAASAAAADDSMQKLNQVSNSIQKTLGLIHQLYLTVSSFNTASQMTLLQRINGLVVELDNMVKLAEKCNIQVPMEVVNLIDDGKNPDEFTRDVINNCIAKNQITKGKTDALKNLRKHLLEELEQNFPDEVETFRESRAASAALCLGEGGILMYLTATSHDIMQDFQPLVVFTNVVKIALKIVRSHDLTFFGRLSEYEHSRIGYWMGSRGIAGYDREIVGSGRASRSQKTHFSGRVRDPAAAFCASLLRLCVSAASLCFIPLRPCFLSISSASVSCMCFPRLLHCAIVQISSAQVGLSVLCFLFGTLLKMASASASGCGGIGGTGKGMLQELTTLIRPSSILPPTWEFVIPVVNLCYPRGCLVPYGPYSACLTNSLRILPIPPSSFKFHK
ncbi:Mediator complex, subunit Med10, partial [Sesbania bispinosa]